MQNSISLEIKQQVAWITLNRPEVRNAFNAELIRDLCQAFHQSSQSSEVNVVVLQGAGKSFCSGADLGYMQAMAGFSHAENLQDANELFKMFMAVKTCRVPVIAKVHGHAMGGAIGLIAASDIVAAEDQTQFCFSEVKIGLVPAVISPFVLARMQVSTAHRLMLTGEKFSSQLALESGLIHFSGDLPATDQFVDSIIAEFRQNGPEAVAATKQLLFNLSEFSQITGADEAAQAWQKPRELTTQVIAQRRVSQEGQEGLQAFLQKRSPSWRGLK